MNFVRKIEGETLTEAPPPPRQWLRPALMISLPLVIVAIGIFLWLTSGRTVSTDNAQLGADVVSMAPEISGRILNVYVKENQQVKKGDLLYEIDPEPYRIALMEAEAALGTARMQVSQMTSDYSSKRADIGSRASDVELARENFQRQRELLGKGFTTRAHYDEARAALSAAQAKVAVSQADAQAARAMLATSIGGHPQVEAAMAQVAKARLDLKRTEVRAPIDGRVSQTDRLTAGSMAMQMLGNITIVGSKAPWVEANFKETQLAKIRSGQPAEVEIDAIPGRTFKAHVLGIGSGTGSAFAILPAQNATGNWVKVTQRVPVRLAFDDPLDRPVVSGWSAHVTVKVKS